MNGINVKVLDVFDHFIYHTYSEDDCVNGLYRIELNGDKAIIFRNGDSWGVLSYYWGEPAKECMGHLRRDRIKVIENAIEQYLSANKSE